MATVYAAKNPGNDLTNKRCARGTVDIATLGARAADDVIYTGCKVPHGAIVTQVTWFVETVCTGDGSSAGTWLMGWSGDSGVNNITPARAMTIVGIELVLTLAGQTWAAGKVHFYAEYYATGDLA